MNAFVFENGERAIIPHFDTDFVRTYLQQKLYIQTRFFLQLQIMFDVAERVRLKRRHTGFIIARVRNIQMLFRKVDALRIRFFRIRHQFAQTVAQVLNHLLLIQFGQKCAEYVAHVCFHFARKRICRNRKGDARMNRRFDLFKIDCYFLCGHTISEVPIKNRFKINSIRFRIFQNLKLNRSLYYNTYRIK